jgi:hypothetical protein
MTAKDFWDTQIPTDANKCYVHDFYAKKFSHEDLFRFAEAYANLKIAEATKGMYPRSFVEWKDMYVQFYAYGNTYYVRSIDKHFVGLESLFEYWKQNIQGE